MYDLQIAGCWRVNGIIRLALARHMPFKSKAQRRKFAQLLVEGKISNQTFEEWNRETGAKKLPERVVRTKPARKKTKTKRKK
jgi:hypothetical protein